MDTVLFSIWTPFDLTYRQHAWSTSHPCVDHRRWLVTHRWSASTASAVLTTPCSRSGRALDWTPAKAIRLLAFRSIWRCVACGSARRLRYEPCEIVRE